MTKLYITRHGQAEGNRDEIIMGQKDFPLTELGQQQAKEKGEKLLNKDISKIYSSDLSRCLETAQIIRQILDLSNAIIETDRRLREISFGIYEGKEQGYITNPPNQISEPFEGGESNQQLIGRVQNFLSDIQSKHEQENILIVTHSGPAAVLESIFENINISNARDKKISFDEIREYNI